MLRYLYILDYNKARACRTTFEPQKYVLLDAAVFAIADQYVLESLRGAAKAKIKSQLDLSLEIQELYPCSGISMGP